MTAADVAGWLARLEEVLPEARRGFMEDRAPEAAGFLVDATPKLIAAVRAVLDLADEMDAHAAANHKRSNAPELRERTAWFYSGVATAQESDAKLLRSAVASALGAEETP